jgi:hypothetical protein
VRVSGGLNGHENIFYLSPYISSYSSASCTTDMAVKGNFLKTDELFDLHIYMHHNSVSGPGSSVGIATAYGLDGPEIESRWGRDFSHLSRSALGPTQPPVKLVPGLSRG